MDMPIATTTVQPATLAFLSSLAKHNEREWFQAHRAQYETALANMRAFTDALIAGMNGHDRIATADAKEALLRIYTDQRFHKDRPPFKPRFAGRMDRVKPDLRGGYYFHIQPGGSFIACGFYGPEAEDLRRIRMDILYDHGTWRKLLQAAALRKTWGGLEGHQLKTAPRGFPKEHEALDLLRRTQFIFRQSFTDQEVLATGFLKEVNKSYQAIRPWMDHMSAVLTTDGNGDPLA